MAFNFNWSPLIADTVRAREMLTTALNKSPKPPIIVDDIIVTELNLGTVPPDLEILEIGDLAQDRFRGIFKMSYAGDAFLTLKTKVQANPLKTNLSTKPSFASPQPLAAASGLTIPLAITLSDIRLSGFVILVFSKQKGLTIVFRNDPLESLKVSSTFDSIPFVRDYLQREIEKQLRNLFMEDLPAILHRLSLRLWSPDHCEPADKIIQPDEDSTVPIDPLATPAQDPVDWLATAFGDDSVPTFSASASTDTAMLFSQKNLQRLNALSMSQRTLSLSTPSIRDVVFRAWAVSNDRSSGLHTPVLSTHSRASSVNGSESSAPSLLSGTASEPTRPGLHGSSSYTYGRSGARQRKRKHRVIDLRKKNVDVGDVDAVTDTSTPEPSIAPSSAPSVVLEPIVEEAPKSPSKVRFDAGSSSTPSTQPSSPVETKTNIPIVVHSSSSKSKLQPISIDEHSETGFPPPAYTPPETQLRDFLSPTSSKATSPITEKPRRPLHLKASSAGHIPLLRSLSADRLAFSTEGSTGGILEQAWLRKMAQEVSRKVDEERARTVQRDSTKGKSAETGSESVGGVFEAPPAYVS